MRRRRAEGVPVRGIYAGMRRRGAIAWPLTVWELQRGKLVGCLHAFTVHTPSKGSGGGPHTPQLMIKHQGQRNVAVDGEDRRGGADSGRGYLEEGLGYSRKWLLIVRGYIWGIVYPFFRLHGTDLHCKASLVGQEFESYFSWKVKSAAGLEIFIFRWRTEPSQPSGMPLAGESLSSSPWKTCRSKSQAWAKLQWNCCPANGLSERCSSG